MFSCYLNSISCKENRYFIPRVFYNLYSYNFYSSVYSNLYRVYEVALTCTHLCYERALSILIIVEHRLIVLTSHELLESLTLLSMEFDSVTDTNIINNIKTFYIAMKLLIL